MSNSPSSAEVALIAYFKALFPLNAEEQEALLSKLSERAVKRRGFLLQEGDICKHVYFIVSGCLKTYAVDESGKEHNLAFAAENDWISDLSSFYSEKPSKLYIEAIEPTKVLQIKHADLLELYIAYHKIDRNFRIIVERKYIALQSRLLQSISMPAEERYRTFLEEYATLGNRLPSTQIASYLGITPEFLSRIRNSLAHQKP